MPTTAPGRGSGETCPPSLHADLLPDPSPAKPNQSGGTRHAGGSPVVLGGLWGPRVQWRQAVGGAGGRGQTVRMGPR